MEYRKEIVKKLIALSKAADEPCPDNPAEFMLWLNGKVPFPDTREPRCDSCGRYYNHPLCLCGL